MNTDEGRDQPDDRTRQATYPIVLSQMAGARAVVIGGGSVGERKVAGLLDVDAAVTVFAPVATARLQRWAEAGKLTWHPRMYRDGDLAEARLVFAATDERDVNARIAQDAATLGLLCNVADAPHEGTFHLPAVHRQPGLTVAVSTNGDSPRRAVRWRNRIAAWLKRENSRR